jgi:Tol biopolymer transport system component
MAPEDREDALGATLDAATSGRTGDGFAVGAVLGNRYRILRHVGEGGMGAVYLARDQALSTDVALKLLTRNLEGTAGFARLRDEVLLAQKVTHENVCRTYDLEEVDGQWLVKMEYVDGQTLAQLVARAPLAVGEAVRIARQIATGLAAAHEKGIVHRDLKPQNVMVEAKSGRVVLMDFGIARLSANAGQTAEGVSGTPEYMAPEQARGREVDGRADLYALGCVMHRMIAGHTVFEAKDPLSAALAHINDAPPDLRTIDPKTPAWIARLVLSLLEKDPTRRPRDANAVIAALAGPTKRKRLPIVLCAVVVLAIAVTVAFAWRGHGKGATSLPQEKAPPPAWHAEVKDHTPIYEENSNGPEISPDGTQLAYESDRDEAGKFRVYVAPLAGGEGRAITPVGYEAMRPRWTTDGRGVIVEHHESALEVDSVIFPLDGGPSVTLVKDSHASACGDAYLLFGDHLAGQDLALRDPSGSIRTIRRFGPEVFVEHPVCDRSGKLVLWVQGSPQASELHLFGDVFMASLPDGEPHQLTHLGTVLTSAVFAPDGKSVIYSARRNEVVNLWEQSLDGGEPRRLTTDQGDDFGPTISPDGKTLAYDLDVTSVPLTQVSLEDHSRRRITSSIEDVTNPSPTPDGKEVVVELNHAGESWIVAITIADGTQRRLVRGTHPAVMKDEVVFSATEAGHLAVIPLAGGEVRPIATLAGKIQTLVPGPDAAVHAMVIRADGVGEGWRVPLDGTPPVLEAKPPWCFHLPSTGTWSVYARCDKHAAFVAPESEGPESAHAHLITQTQARFTSDGKSVVIYDYNTGAIDRLDLATGEETRIASGPVSPEAWSLAIDDRSVFACAVSSHIRRELITNFADRPR